MILENHSPQEIISPTSYEFIYAFQNFKIRVYVQPLELKSRHFCLHAHSPYPLAAFDKVLPRPHETMYFLGIHILAFSWSPHFLTTPSWSTLSSSRPSPKRFSGLCPGPYLSPHSFPRLLCPFQWLHAKDPESVPWLQGALLSSRRPPTTVPLTALSECFTDSSNFTWPKQTSWLSLPKPLLCQSSHI